MTVPDSGFGSVHVDLAGDVAKFPRALGAATDVLLGGRASTLVIDMGRNALNPRLIGAVAGWMRRHDTVLRTRLRAVVFVVPGFWAALQWWLAGVFGGHQVPSRVVRSLGRARAWFEKVDAAQRGATGQPT